MLVTISSMNMTAMVGESRVGAWLGLTGAPDELAADRFSWLELD